MEKVKTILAVAVGPERTMQIGSQAAASDVRPYVEGLIRGLAKYGRHIGTDFEIEYKERPQLDGKGGQAAETFNPKTAKPHDLIFCMSTTVVRAAKGVNKSTPIVGVVSDPKAEGFGGARNVTGISARRSQTAGQCFESFLGTVPTLRRVFVLHKPKYGPSDRALKLVKAVAKKHGVAVRPVPVKSRQDLEKKLAALPKRDPKKPADAGVFVNPVDVCLGAAQTIIDVAQKKKMLPVFFPVTDWVTPDPDGALGGRGVPQLKCGELMAKFVDQILWHGATPGSLKITPVDDDAFEWVVSSEAAKALNIQLPHVI